MGVQSTIDLPTGMVDAHQRTVNARISLIVGVATVAAAFFQLWGIGARPLWVDEAYSTWFSALDWHRLWLETPRYEPHAPLYYSMLKLWRVLAGDDAAALRGLSALAGIATVPLLALAARELGSLAGARRPFLLIGTAAALGALSPRLLLLGQDARPYALLVFSYALATFGWLCLTHAFREGKCGSAGAWATLGVGTALVMWLHPLGILYGTALFASLLITAAPGATPARWTRLAATVALVTLLYLPCLLMLAGRSGDWGSGWLMWDPLQLPRLLLDLVSLYKSEESVTPTLSRMVIPVLLFIGLRSIVRTEQRSIGAGLALLLLLPPLAAALISQLGTPVFLPRTLAGVLVPAYLIVALVVANLPRRLVLPVSGGLAILFLVNLAQFTGRPPMERWDQVAATLQREMRPGDAIWVYPNDLQLPLEHALGKAAPIAPIPAPYPALHSPGTHPSGSPAVVAINAEAARTWAARQGASPRATIWVVRGGPSLFDPGDGVLSQLAGDRRVGAQRQWDNLDLHALHPAGER